MSEPETPNDPRKKPERINLKLVLIWLGVLAVIALLLPATIKSDRPVKTLQIGQVLNSIKEGKVKSLDIAPDPTLGDKSYVLRGVMTPATPSPKTGDNPAAKPGVDAPKAPDDVRFEAYGLLTDVDIRDIRTALPDAQAAKPQVHFEYILWQALPMLVIGGLLAYLLYRMMKSANRNAMSFAKSRAKLLGKDKERATFKDVAGCDEAKEDVQEIVEYLREPKKFQKIGGRIPKGVLLVGPPGTGKTLLARATAGEAEVPFFSISGSDFVEMFVGVGAARVRDMFEQARKSAPAILFIDEIDAVGRQRGAGHGGGHDEREQTLNSLLVEMDGIEGNEGIIVIAATNRVDVLDAALLRPGRFDRHVRVELPDINGREEILKVHAKKVKLGPGVDLRHVARITAGCSGAELANLLNESALLAARLNKKEVNTVDIEQSNDKISFGAERRKLMDEEDRRKVAYHEAGHALVQALVEDAQMKLHKVTIIPRGGALGMAMIKPEKDILGQSRKQLLDRICMTMGGRIGEEVLTGDFSNGASGDIRQATNIARRMVCEWGMSDLGPVALGNETEFPFYGRDIGRARDTSEATAARVDSEIKRIISEQYDRCSKIIAAHGDALRTVAEALLEYETLDAVHIHEVLRHGEIRTPVEYRPFSTKSREKNTPAPGSREEAAPVPPFLGGGATPAPA